MKKYVSSFDTTVIKKRCTLLTTAFLLLTVPVFLSATPANAVEELKYTSANETGPSFRLQLNAFLKQNFNSDSSDYEMAETDLNDDNLLEHVLKRKNCGKYTNICTYLVVAEQGKNLGLLSKISALRLIIGDDKNYGIKNLLAFNNPKNAYDFDIYIWSPSEKMYILGADEIRN